MPKTTKRNLKKVLEQPEGFVHARDAGKTFRELAAEAVEEPNPIENKVLADEAPVKEEANAPEETQPTEALVEQPPQSQPTPEELAEKVAAAAAERVEKRLAEREENAQKAREQEAATKQLEEELTPVWQREGRQPADWNEALQELERINEIKLQRRIDEVRAKEKEELTAKERQQVEERERQEQAIQEQVARVQSSIDAELEEMYERNVLPRPKNGQPSEEVSDLLNFGIRLNKERAEQNKQPVSSVSTLYYLHYKPYKDAQKSTVKQPAGADAPVSGAKATITTQSNDGYVWARDHRKSYRQILAETLRG